MEELTQNNHGTVLKELSDIKASLAVNTSETGNIKASIAEIKLDMKEIKNDFINRRELNESLKTVREEFAPLGDHELRIRAIESKVWKAIGALAVANAVILPVVLYLFFKLI